MRICIIAPPWVAVPPPAYGGTEAVLDTLARGLELAGHDVLLATTGDATCPVTTTWTFAESVGVGVSGPAAELRHVIHAYEAAREFDAEVVHDHTLVGPIYALQIAGLPVVTTNHGPFDSPELGPYYRSIGARVPIIAISRHHASTAPPTPVAAVIHHGLDAARFPVGKGEGGYAAFLGRMHPDKGVDTACRVARAAGVPLKVAAKMSEAHELAYFNDVVEPLLGGDIEFVGELDGVDKATLLGDASCLLNPIRWPEPFGMVMIEALACGTPVVARACGSVPELIDHGVTGFVADSDAGLAAALGQVAALDRTDCRLAAEVRFSAVRMVAEHLVVYERRATTGSGRRETVLAG